MHEDTQRRLVRAAFVLLCIVPTLVCGVVAIYRALPSTRQNLERRLSHDLGVDVRFDSMSTPRPLQLRLNNVRVLDHETQALLLSFPRIDAALTDQGWRIRFGNGTADAAGLRSLWTCLRHRIMTQELFTKQVADIAGQQLDLQLGEQTLAMHHFVWAGLSEGADHKSVIEFYPHPTEDRKATQPIQVLLERDRSESPARTHVRLVTGRHAIPLSLLCQVARVEQSPQGTFRGTVPIEWRHEAWTARIEDGELSNLDLSDLAANWLPQAVTGTVTLQNINAILDATGLRRADSQVHASHLSLPHSMLAELMRAKLLSAGPDFKPPAQVGVVDQRYDIPSLDLKLTLNERGFTSIGALDKAVAATTEKGPLFISHAQITVSDLVRALVLRDSIKNDYELADRWQQLLPPTVPYVRQARK